MQYEPTNAGEEALCEIAKYLEQIRNELAEMNLKFDKIETYEGAICTYEQNGFMRRK